MKKLIIVSLIPIFVFLFPIGALISGVFLTGCAPDSSENIDLGQSNEETVLSPSEYPYLNQFLGSPTNQDLLEGLNGTLKTMDALNAGEHTTEDEWISMYSMMQGLYDLWVGVVRNNESHLSFEEEMAYTRILDGTTDVLEIANQTGVGTPLNQFIDQAGSDVLTNNVLPMIEYAFANGDDEGSSGKISRKDFDALMEVLHRMLNKNDKVYGDVWDAISNFLYILRTQDIDLTVGETKSFVEYIVEKMSNSDEADEETKELFAAIQKAIGELWDDGQLVLEYAVDERGIVQYDENGDLIELNPPQVLRYKDEFRRLLYSAGLLLDEKMSMDGYNSWDHGDMTDFSRMLYGLEELLNEDILLQDKIRTFLSSVLAASEKLDGSNSLGGGLRAIGTTDPAYLQGLDTAVDLLIKQTLNGEFRKDLSHNSTSALRAVLFLVRSLNKFSRDLNINAGSMISSMDGGTLLSLYTDGTNPRPNIMSWSIGEMAIALNEKDNPFQGFNYVFYEKDYGVLGNSLGDGLIGLLENPQMSNMLGVENNLTNYGITDSLPALYIAIGAAKNEENGGYLKRSGITHQILAPAAPIIQHYWNWKGHGKNWEYPMVEMMISMNELSNANNYSTDNVTGVLKTIEGIHGYGFITYALREHSDIDDTFDNGILDPLLFMLHMTVNKMTNTDYTYDVCKNPCILYCDDYGKTCTLFSALMDYLEDHSIFGFDPDTDYKNIIPYLFDPVEDDSNRLDLAYKFVKQKHDSLAVMAQGVGGILKAISQDPEHYDQIMDDLETIIPILNQILGGDNTTEAAQSGIQYMFAENSDGSDNPFIDNLKAILYKAFDLQHTTYHPDGKMTENSTISEMSEYLYGDENFKGGIYDMEAVKNFMQEMDKLNFYVFNQFLEEVLWVLIGNTGNSSYGFSRSNLPSAKFIKALTLAIDVNEDNIKDKSILERILGVLHPETDMNGLFEDTTYLFNTEDLRPGGYLYQMMLDLLKIAEDNIVRY